MYTTRLLICLLSNWLLNNFLIVWTLAFTKPRGSSDVTYVPLYTVNGTGKEKSTWELKTSSLANLWSMLVEVEAGRSRGRDFCRAWHNQNWWMIYPRQASFWNLFGKCWLSLAISECSSEIVQELFQAHSMPENIFFQKGWEEQSHGKNSAAT